MSDKMREAFEKWAKSECLDTDSVDGFYSDNDTHIAWGAWKAAKSAAVPVIGDVVAYDLSADYVKLLEFLKAGNDAAGFVTTDDYHNGDVVGVTRRGPYNIHIGVRGYSFASVYPFNSEDGSEEEVFIKACEFSRLKWIKPHHSISATELERLQQNDARWIKANEGGKFCISEWKQLPMVWADLTPETAIKRIDAAIAQEQPK